MWLSSIFGEHAWIAGLSPELPTQERVVTGDG
jgi:hypothetical protein